jgi:serine/threonine kinase PknH
MGVFISYCSQDRSTVDKLVTALRSAHQQVWLDEELSGGEAWWRMILEQIRSCEVFLVAMSQHWVDSKPCQAELGYAQDLQRPILPVQIGALDSMRVIPLAGVQIIDYRNPSADTGIDLISAVHERRERAPALPSPLPAEPPVPFAYLMRLATTVRGEELSAKQQTQLISELQSGIDEDARDASARHDIAQLLRLLRDRPDVTWRTRNDIEQMLTSIDSMDSASPSSAAPSSADVASGPQPVAGAAAALGAPPDTGAAPHEQSRLKWIQSRPKWIIAGGAGLAAVVAIVVVLVLVGSGSGPPAPTTTSAVPPVTPQRLDSILLSAAAINTIMGTTNIQPTTTTQAMTSANYTLSNPNCSGALFPAQEPAYQGSGYSAVSLQGLAEPGNSDAHQVFQAAVAFPSVDKAGAFGTSSADKWKACAGQTVTATLPNGGGTTRFTLGNLTGTYPKLALLVTAAAGSNGYTCQHALSTVSNVVIDVTACRNGVTNQGSQIADQMLANV